MHFPFSHKVKSKLVILGNKGHETTSRRRSPYIVFVQETDFEFINKHHLRASGNSRACVSGIKIDFRVYEMSRIPFCAIPFGVETSRSSKSASRPLREGRGERKKEKGRIFRK